MVFDAVTGTPFLDTAGLGHKTGLGHTDFHPNLFSP